MAASSDDEDYVPPVRSKVVPSPAAHVVDQPLERLDEAEDERPPVRHRRTRRDPFDIESFGQRHLVCSLCNRFYNDPKTLPCLDSYCMNCLERKAREQRAEREREVERAREEVPVTGPSTLVDEDDDDYLPSLRARNVSPSSSLSFSKKQPHIDNFVCPQQGCHEIDTGVTVDDDGTVREIPQSNKFLANLIKTIELKKHLPSGTVLCEKCVENEVAIAVCNNPECANIPLCAKCLESHLRQRETREHNIVHPSRKHSKQPESSGGAVDGGGDEPPDKWKNFDRRTWHCDKHPNFLIDRYCYNHECTICMQCQLVEDCHLGCRSIKLTERCIDFEVGPLVELLEQAEKMQEEFEVAIHNIEKMQASLTSNKDWTLNSINEHYQKLADCLEQQRAELTDQTEEICGWKMRELEKHKIGLQNIVETFSRSLDFIGESMDTAIPSEFMFLKESFHNRLRYLISYYYNRHKLPTDVNDKVFLQLNESFSVDGAIGKVCGAPFINAFTLVPQTFPVNLRARNAYTFKIQGRDICRGPVCGNLPPLEAIISEGDDLPNEYDPAVLSNRQGLDCFVHCNNEDGVYTVYMYPFCAGRHRIYVFSRQAEPLEPLFVRGFPLYVDVQP